MKKGVLEGPSIMPGGQKEAYELLVDVLEEISKKHQKLLQTRCDYIGPMELATHYVKMVHPVMEYGDINDRRSQVTYATLFGLAEDMAVKLLRNCVAYF